MDLKFAGPITTILAALADIVRARRENMDPELLKEYDEIVLADYKWLRKKLGIGTD